MDCIEFPKKICTDGIAKDARQWLNLLIEPYPNLQGCLVRVMHCPFILIQKKKDALSIHIMLHQDEVYCYVFSVDVTHIRN